MSKTREQSKEKRAVVKARDYKGRKAFEKSSEEVFVKKAKRDAFVLDDNMLMDEFSGNGNFEGFEFSDLD